MAKEKKPRLPDAILENVRVFWPNFSGAGDDFNAEGKRNFHVELAPDVAQQMAQDGWHIKERTREIDGELETVYSIKVNVNFDGRPPAVYQITYVHGKMRRVMLPETLVSLLDDAEITNVDLILSSNYWEMGGKTGYSAYLKSGYFTINEDPLARKYSELQFGEDDE